MTVRISRRALLKGGAVVGAMFGGGSLPGFMRRALAAADEGPARCQVLAFLFLRGAMDGLNVAFMVRASDERRSL